MKKALLFIIKRGSRFGAIVYPYSFAKFLGVLRSRIYTYWVTTKFKHFDDSSVFIFPITILGEKYISVGKNVTIGSRTILTAWDNYENIKFNPQITIGDNVSIGEDCHITAINKIEIGDNVLMGKKITITDNAHGKSESEALALSPIKRPLFSKGSVIIESGVWIGDKVTILGGVKIGKNCIIGANSVVTSNIPENCVVGGIPAKILKNLNL
ncbi:MAG: hypothetical protein RL662_575 [Bacteroidota bacterium]|jgi:acetyltransferase-like isoleucine patch superfamily enzyme